MRQQHQKSRSRGRGRKPQNPLSRNYESNGPDVKIRGNAGHIAEKYSTLARDALSNGDTVMAENYFQHAEHYNRIVATAQAQRAEEQAASGRGPQPEIEGTPAEAASGNEGEKSQANGSDAEASSETPSEDKPQKSGRGRRPRKNATAANDASDADAGDNKPQVNGSDGAQSDDGEQADVAIEAISEDAAKLPESITGGMQAEES